jgi:hypothetical protein
MPSNDNWHLHAGRDCCTGCPPGFTQPSLSPYSAWPLPMAFPPAPPRCPATTRHTELHSLGTTGIQCKYEPGHDGDHAGPGGLYGDVFWPQEAPVAEPRGGGSTTFAGESVTVIAPGGSGSGGSGSYRPSDGTTVTVT